MEAPILLTFDNHTDTKEAFLFYLFNKIGDRTDVSSSYEKIKKYALELINKIDINYDKSLEEAILILRNDEHIDTAIKTGIISKAFVIQYSKRDDKPCSIELTTYTSKNHDKFMKKLRRLMGKEIFENGIDEEELKKPHRPYTYNEPENNIYVVGNTCYSSCKRMPHNNDCDKFLYDQAIESDFIKYKLEIFKEMCPEIFINNILNKNYILDIDLDYFHTKKSICPDDPTEFYKLIKNSHIITIALEKNYFKEIEGYEFSSAYVNYILKKILMHIKRALK